MGSVTGSPRSSAALAMARRTLSSVFTASRARICMPSPSSQASRKNRALAIDPSITTSVQPAALNVSSTFPNWPSFTQVQASTSFSSAGSVWFTCAAATTR